MLKGLVTKTGLSGWYRSGTMFEKRKTEKKYNEFYVLYTHMSIFIYSEEDIQQ